MPLFRKKPVVIEAHKWHKNGDHPLDYIKEVPGIAGGDITTFTPEEQKANDWEGQLVRRFRNPDVDGQSVCKHCGEVMDKHGWIDTLEGGHNVCPGDWIITGVQGEHYPCKPSIFEQTYEKAE